MSRSLCTPLAAAWLAGCLASPTAWAGPHQHGLARLDVAVDGPRLTVTMEAPLDGFLGFERAPRTEAEKKAAADLLVRLRAGQGLFLPEAAAGCTLHSARVTAAVLEPGARSPAAARGDHADLDAEYVYTCREPQALRQIDVGLFDAYPRLQRIEVQVAGAQAQSKVTLRRPARRVPLATPAR